MLNEGKKPNVRVDPVDHADEERVAGRVIEVAEEPLVGRRDVRARIGDAEEGRLVAEHERQADDRPADEYGGDDCRTFDRRLSAAGSSERLRYPPLSAEPDPADPFWGDDPNSAINRLRRARDHLVPWVDQTFPLAGATVLEFGCGHGPVSCAFATRAERVIGVDVEAEYVADGRRFVAECGAENVELHHHPVGEIVDAVAARTGEIDVFLLYAVLEHLTLDERLDAARARARGDRRRSGVIVVCEAPNRLFPFDHHTTRLPFFTMLPDDLALRYWRRSERPDFRKAMDEAVHDGREAEALARWGRGVSYHDFELAFEDLGAHVGRVELRPSALRRAPGPPRRAGAGARPRP